MDYNAVIYDATKSVQQSMYFLTKKFVGEILKMVGKFREETQCKKSIELLQTPLQNHKIDATFLFGASFNFIGAL